MTRVKNTTLEVKRLQMKKDQEYHKMILSSLKVGQEFANFKELCRYLNIEDYAGATQKGYIEDKFKQFFQWERKKSGYKLTITKILDKPLPKFRRDASDLTREETIRRLDMLQ